MLICFVVRHFAVQIFAVQYSDEVLPLQGTASVRGLLSCSLRRRTHSAITWKTLIRAAVITLIIISMNLSICFGEKPFRTVPFPNPFSSVLLYLLFSISNSCLHSPHPFQLSHPHLVLGLPSDFPSHEFRSITHLSYIRLGSSRRVPSIRHGCTSEQQLCTFFSSSVLHRILPIVDRSSKDF